MTKYLRQCDLMERYSISRTTAHRVCKHMIENPLLYPGAVIGKRYHIQAFEHAYKYRDAWTNGKKEPSYYVNEHPEISAEDYFDLGQDAFKREVICTITETLSDIQIPKNISPQRLKMLIGKAIIADVMETEVDL